MTRGPAPGDRVRKQARELLPLALMIAGVLFVYCPLPVLGGAQTLLGHDFNDLHAHRIRYAQEAFATGSPWPPAWYTRELLGTPFWSNPQSFPFLPTRLALLWLPVGAIYPIAVNLAAALAALGTYAYVRALGLSRCGAAVAGWTFAASGFFAVRVYGGHLPLLEAFAALPLLLVCVERLALAEGAGSASPWTTPRRHLALAAAAGCVALAGHPQLPAYALLAATVYALFRLPLARGAAAVASIALGVGLAAFAWVPTLGLIARSTRVVALAAAENDVAFPLWRLKAFLLPWADGWPSVLPRTPPRAFADPVELRFWDTVCYVGWLPLLALVVLAGRALWRRKSPSRPMLFLVLAGGAALLLATPIVPGLFEATGSTLLRSPARLLYLTVFALSVAAGSWIDVLVRAGAGRTRLALRGLALALAVFHVADLTTHDHTYVRATARLPVPRAPPESAQWAPSGARAAIDCNLYVPENRAVDDVGFFDSLMLARSYRAVMAMANAPPDFNAQMFEASVLSTVGLASLCVHRVVTDTMRGDLRMESFGAAPRMHWSYAVQDPLARATFVPDRLVDYAPDDAVLERYRRGQFDLRTSLALPPAARPVDYRPGGTPGDVLALRCERPAADRIEVGVEPPSAGWVRVVESFDEGWSATLDGAPAEIVPADAFAMAVRVRPGARHLELAYRTPVARTGWIVTAASAAGLAALAWLLRARHGSSRARAS